MKIKDIDAYTVFDSRGIPTIEAEILLENGARGRGTVPSGASTGQFEALELRDGDPKCFGGKSVEQAIRHVRTEIRDAVLGKSVEDQREIDKTLITLDGTPNKSRLGANSILAASMAAANALANARGVMLFEVLGEGTLLPLPETQIIGGGAHANWRTDIQDFLVIATGAKTYDDALRITHDVFHATGKIMKERGKYFGVADEGGYWPEFQSNEEAFEVILRGIERAGYVPGTDVCFSIDMAASDLYEEKTGLYRFRLEDRVFNTDDFAAFTNRWCDKYPIVSLEDPIADIDIKGWKLVYEAIGDRVQLIGDDLFTTSTDRIRHGIDNRLANAALIKLNQIGTVTQTIDAIRLTQKAGWRPVVSARSGETEDAFISHLAVATDAGQLKVGSFSRSERMVKWNEISRIARVLGKKARFTGEPFALNAAGKVALKC